MVQVDNKGGRRDLFPLQISIPITVGYPDAYFSMKCFHHAVQVHRSINSYHLSIGAGKQIVGLAKLIFGIGIFRLLDIAIFDITPKFEPNAAGTKQCNHYRQKRAIPRCFINFPSLYPL